MTRLVYLLMAAIGCYPVLAQRAGPGVADALTMGGPVDATHPNPGPAYANNLGQGVAAADCPTSTQDSTSFLCIRGRTGATPRQNYAVNVTLDSYAGATPDPVALYGGVRAHAGSPQAWALNTVTHLEPGGNGGMAYEADLNNFDCDAGGDGGRIPAAPGCGHAPPIGLLVTGASPYPAGAAIKVSGVSQGNAQWHYGLTMIGGYIVDGASLYTDNASHNDYEMRGNHAVGLEMAAARFSAAAIHLAEGHRLTWSSPGSVHTLLSDEAGFHFVGQAGPLLDVNNAGDLTIPDGRRYCWAGPDRACVAYQAGTGRFTFLAAGADGALREAASIDGRTGDMVIRGTLTQRGRP